MFNSQNLNLVETYWTTNNNNKSSHFERVSQLKLNQPNNKPHLKLDSLSLSLNFITQWSQKHYDLKETQKISLSLSLFLSF
jgi:hypothetical protein